MRSRASRYSLVVFDFDGTLVDSAGCITLSVERALADCGRACDAASVRGHIGLPLDCIIRAASAGIADEAIDPVIAAYRGHHAGLERELVALFPGAEEVVEALHAGGVRLAVATNKLTERARASLDRFGIADRFDAIVGADQVAHPKPHPDLVRHVLARTGHAPSAALMVGDTVWDVEMARQAGVASCAVTWGNHDAARLAGADPTHAVDTWPALRAVIERAVR